MPVNFTSFYSSFFLGNAGNAGARGYHGAVIRCFPLEIVDMEIQMLENTVVSFLDNDYILK